MTGSRGNVPRSVTPWSQGVPTGWGIRHPGTSTPGPDSKDISLPVTNTAQATTSTFPGECLDGLEEVTHRLRDALGVTITHTSAVPPDDIGWWESPTNTVIVRADATAEEQVWLLVHIWLLLVVGPDAVNAVTEPMLALVPPPRDPT